MSMMESSRSRNRSEPQRVRLEGFIKIYRKSASANLVPGIFRYFKTSGNPYSSGVWRFFRANEIVVHKADSGVNRGHADLIGFRLVNFGAPPQELQDQGEAQTHSRDTCPTSPPCGRSAPSPVRPGHQFSNRSAASGDNGRMIGSGRPLS